VEGELARTFGRNLRRYREARGLSQEKLAADVFEKHRTYIGDLERGVRNPSLKVVERLAAAIGVDALTLLTPAEEPEAREQAKTSNEAGGGQEPEGGAPA
jgi:transcriptional regulator with XRE-family HTH domain